MSMTPEKKSILILGIGNLLMGDEGVGVHAIEYLKTRQWPPNVSLIDGGTGGFHLLGYFQEYDPLIIIDACTDDQPPGAVRVITPQFDAEFPPLVSMHDVGLREIIESAAFTGSSPKVHLIAVSIGALSDMSVDLSPAVKDALPQIAAAAEQIVRESAKKMVNGG
jgi:hydrogenase maturation protease